MHGTMSLKSPCHFLSCTASYPLHNGHHIYFSLFCVFVCFLLFALLFLSALVSVFPTLCPKCLFSFLIKALSFYSISSSPLKLFSVCHFFSSLHASFFDSSYVCCYCSTLFIHLLNITVTVTVTVTVTSPNFTWLPLYSYRGSTVVKVLCYKSEGRWFDSSWCQWIFHWQKTFRSHYDSGVGSASNRNEYQEYFLGVKVAGAWG